LRESKQMPRMPRMSNMITLSHSKISTWKSCRRQYKFIYDDKISPIDEPTYFALGRSIHDSLSKFYAIEPEMRTQQDLVNWFAKSLADDWSRLTSRREAYPDDERDYKSTVENGYTMLTRYWNRYGIDKQIGKCLTEHQVSVQLTDNLSFTGKLDCLTSNWIIEHKTGNITVEDLALEDDQSFMYCWLMRKVGRPVKGTVYNIIPSPTAQSSSFQRVPIERTDNELASVESEILQIAEEIEWLPRLPTRSYSCKSCQFRMLCRAERQGGDVEYLIDSKFRRANETA